MPIEHVREINQLVEITPVPDAPVCVFGVTKLRERIIPVLDLRIKFKLSKPELDKEACVITLESPQGLMGTVVESVHSVIQLNDASLEKPTTLAGRHMLGLARLNGEIIVLIDIVACLSMDELSKISELPMGLSAQKLVAEKETGRVAAA